MAIAWVDDHSIEFSTPEGHHTYRFNLYVGKECVCIIPIVDRTHGGPQAIFERAEDALINVLESALQFVRTRRDRNRAGRGTDRPPVEPPSLD